MKLVLAFVASALCFGLCIGMAIDDSPKPSTLACDSMMSTTYFNKTTVGEIFNKSLGWNKRAHSFDCFGPEKVACEKFIDEKFLNMTNNFDLTTVDDNNVTLAQAFCNKFPDVPRTKVRLGQFYSCKNFQGSSITGEAFYNNYSKQNLECVKGKAIVTPDKLKLD